VGSWQAWNCFKDYISLKTDQTSYPLWQSEEIDIHNFEYKYVIVNGSKV